MSEFTSISRYVSMHVSLHSCICSRMACIDGCIDEWMSSSIGMMLVAVQHDVCEHTCSAIHCRYLVMHICTYRYVHMYMCTQAETDRRLKPHTAWRTWPVQHTHTHTCAFVHDDDHLACNACTASAPRARVRQPPHRSHPACACVGGSTPIRSQRCLQACSRASRRFSGCE
jgi:hypothetical protein